MTINPQRAQALFLSALELSEPAARREFLDRECGSDSALRQRVEALLGAHDAAGGFGDKPSRPGFDATIDEPTVARPGSLLAGRYKLIEAIGEGGMGSVWVAEQREPVRRKVAIKLIKAGMDSKSVLARFEAERQALAMMDHPNIAKVFDGGVTDQGRPFFVMEYVKGVPLADYCDQARLSLKERLNLFMPVCQAVQHAHQKGIIHRDLKPSNILICLYDGEPVPKVIDFGLAKAMHQSLTDQSLHTAHGVMVGTPLYMSPEQAEHNNLDVDTRTDIYSLGVILYELLTGSTPLERQQMKNAAFNEILRLIKEVEPQKPSTRLSSSQNLPSIAAQRSIEPNQLKRSVTGDLDWIVMKALDKERSRRYETANGLARDVERYLNDEAVEASPPSSIYRLRKLLRKHRTALTTAAAFGLLLIWGRRSVSGRRFAQRRRKETPICRRRTPSHPRPKQWRPSNW
jgi:serine/threonine protein kinase